MEKKEKAILVGVKFKNDLLPLSESLEELKRLVYSSGAETIAVLTQTKERPDSKYFIGSGKLKELQELLQGENADLVIFDHELSPSQARNLEEELRIKIVDRTELILDIFAQHAHTAEGRLQVELAQLDFMQTHLVGHGVALSRLGGGIGTRGPGETKLETDRRIIRKRISLLKKEIEKLGKKREVLRTRRKASDLKVAALVGYTNSGKSTLLNTLTDAKVLTQDKLFATLDPVTRRFYLDGKTILITDTVGFIQKLPHQLVDAFKSTLEETIEADLLLNVVDVSSSYAEHQIEAVNRILSELNVVATPMVYVFNKIDKESDECKLRELAAKYKPAVFISALNGKGLDDLLKIASNRLGH
ncbi:GTPase HflX [candidate division WOR-1 bacterium RIFOXYA12_FULL_43_27]|uniref:GTPase HflX n=1 Tax=candidate division WOR-1 bacterium RIFOXYC2_FULL_46_14 TaxID=1802587 RepID=A0A1F4U7U0_UNCSA|nr:MAG: GTPase HflX [candidate division WOR-1 bacterium RIFOXYA12_FULL_43_27]OGC19310.1 MAG: GTPase HflX [candidate division WOR-1 bacterium RIFOXYB2_FULL_46_45]OGC30299.1 MAG: GTPase HflX [candidate division WOR-1 bacterium RIFOXYA2_FULL_46_56]OGC40900.1 MAG: GTPase HflX [candidate division WOR-1 bacterium RIFOXYC2_FULL_46_14]